MAINKLTVINGIIQDKYIDGIPVKIQIVEPKGAKNVRTLIKMKECIGITNHNTGNSAPTASDEMHAKWMQNVENADKLYVSVHLYVDHDSITQTVPLDEVCYHAGDGKGNGNYKTIGVEICENVNITRAEVNAKKLNAALILTYQKLMIFKHQDWSGKFCPRIILGRNGWNKFVEDIKAYAKGPTVIEKKLTVTLRRGMVNKDVKTLQERLNNIGYKLTADGDFGALTEKAVRDFQLTNRLLADGIVGQKTWDKLYNV
jgi:N-acetylmuramoyl-L-alanine amidase